jgi:hypothetical protein
MTALEKKHEIFTSTMNTTLSEMASRIDSVEKRSSTMIFQQEEPECDIVVVH